MTLTLPSPDVRALVTGEAIIAFVPHGAVSEGVTVTLAVSGPRPAHELKPAYRRWADLPAPSGTWTATVERVVASAAFDPDQGAARHILMAPESKDVAVLRVSGTDGPVLSDAAHDARMASLAAALGS